MTDISLVSSDTDVPIGTVMRTQGQLFDNDGNNQLTFSTCGEPGNFDLFDQACKKYFGDEWDYANQFVDGDWCKGIYWERFPFCVKRRHIGNPAKCCFEGQDTRVFGNLGYPNKATCDPVYDGTKSPIPTTCQPHFMARCAPNGNWDMNDKRCMAFAKENRDSTYVIDAISAECASAGSPVCRQWLSDPANHGKYDQLMKTYCANVKANEIATGTNTIPGTEPLCYCINSPVITDKTGPFTYDPICLGATQCISNDAYKLKSNLDAQDNCPTQLCIANQDIAAGGKIAVAGGIKVEQNCSGGISINENTNVPDPTNQPAPADDNPPPSTQPSKSNSGWLVFLFIFIIIAVVVGVIVWRRRSRKMKARLAAGTV